MLSNAGKEILLALRVKADNASLVHAISSDVLFLAGTSPQIPGSAIQHAVRMGSYGIARDLLLQALYVSVQGGSRVLSEYL